jgi:hypothetical protein
MSKHVKNGLFAIIPELLYKKSSNSENILITQKKLIKMFSELALLAVSGLPCALFVADVD